MSLCENPKQHPEYLFGSVIITIVLGSLSFIVALAWSTYVNKVFEYYESRSDEIDARLSYAFFITSLAIIIAFFAVYFISGDRL